METLKDTIIDFFKQRDNIVIVKNELFEIIGYTNHYNILCSFWDNDLSFKKHKYLVLDKNEFNLYLRILKLSRIKENIKNDGNSRRWLY